MRDGDVLEGDVELGSASEEIGAYAGGDGFSLRDQFGGVELGDDGLEDFVANGGEDTLVVIKAEGLEGESISMGQVGYGLGGCGNNAGQGEMEQLA